MATQRGAVTLSDIALRTGVSKVTVSSVLNGRATSNVRVSDPTRQRILAAAREMGYHPNAVARALTRRRTDTVALVLHSPAAFSGGSGFISALMHGVVEAVNALGYDLMLHTAERQDAQREALALTDGRVDGVLLLRDRDDPLVGQLEERGFSNVSIFSRPDITDPWFVDGDNVAGGRIAGEYLLSLGHRNIGFVAGPERSAPVSDRLAGLRAALVGAGIDGPAQVCRIKHPADDLSELAAWFDPAKGGATAPTAVFVWSDDVALRVVTLLREVCGLRVPEDVSVIGYDGTDAIGEHSVPRLTSIRQPIYDIATRGVQTLVARIRSPEEAQRQQLFPPTLVVRDSCAPPPTT